MANGESYIPIDKAQLEQQVTKANALVKNASWKPTADKVKASTTPGTGQWRDSIVASDQEEKVSLVQTAIRVSKDALLLTDTANHTLNTIRKGLQVGMHLSGLYTKFSGLETLIELNKRRASTQMQDNEFRAKYTTVSAITLFVAAYYISWELSRYRTEEVAGAKFEFQGIPEVHLLTPTRAMDCMIYYLGAYLEKSGAVNTDLDFVKMTLLYCNAMVEEIKQRKDSFQYAEFFTDKAYKLQDSEFAVRGFETTLDAVQAASVEFNRVKYEEIVGNRDAKHKGKRTMERLACFDPKSKRNPMYDLGGLTTFSMGFGVAGTGKSLQIAADATYGDELCKTIPIPFLFWPFPDNIVSTFQGGSAERATEWFKPFRDPTRIIYAPIDDAENTLEERTRQGVSAGVREVIGVVLRNTEGAYAVHYGNAVLRLFTNLPEQIDKAVLSRIQDRFGIDGARRIEDFIDQEYLWYRKFAKIDPKFVNLKDPARYEYLKAQRDVSSLAEVYDGVKSPANDTIRKIYDEVRAKFDPEKEHEFYARFYLGVQQEFPTFSSRDVRNIQRMIDDRIMDFDLEKDWLENPEKFFRQDYDTKYNMIVELMKANMKGLSFAEIRLQEVIRYIDMLVKIGNTDFERRVETLISEAKVRDEAMNRHKRKAS